MSRLVEMAVESVRVHMLSNRHVVILKDVEGERYLPIWIGQWEASAIAMRLQGFEPERPLTHDLFSAALAGLGSRLDRIVISDLSEETYHARLFLELDGREIELDARPSDGIALAVRSGARIYAAEEVLDAAALGSEPQNVDDAAGDEPPSGEGGRPRPARPGLPLESIGEAPVDPRLDLFRDFINSLDMEPGTGGSGREGGGRR